MAWLTRLLGVDQRNSELRAWGQSVPVSAAQRIAMRELWVAWETKTQPSVDPLAHLSDSDRQYIRKICSAAFRPARFGDANAMRMAGLQTCGRAGFTPEQAAVLVGMTLNNVGPVELVTRSVVPETVVATAGQRLQSLAEAAGDHGRRAVHVRHFGVEDLDRAWQSSRPGLTDQSIPAAQRRYERLRATAPSSGASYCLTRFISAELDFVGPGSRGMGRFTAEPPRLAAYFRQRFVNLSVSDVEELRDRVQELILTGYLSYALCVDGGDQGPLALSGDQLLQKWIPRIYATDYELLPEFVRNTLSAFSAASANGVLQFLSAHKMKGGGFLSRDWVPTILMYYVVAGFGLRSVELKGE